MVRIAIMPMRQGNWVLTTEIISKVLMLFLRQGNRWRWGPIVTEIFVSFIWKMVVMCIFILSYDNSQSYCRMTILLSIYAVLGCSYWKKIRKRKKRSVLDCECLIFQFLPSCFSQNFLVLGFFPLPGDILKDLFSAMGHALVNELIIMIPCHSPVARMDIL